ncbi:MAG TPA: hypothetical protein VK166_02315 [Chitinophagaceae bacterium]|nr:hypothetical protein [Chitinophagaceae bacterium]
MKYTVFVLFILSFLACKQQDTEYSDEELVDPESVLAYEENDTLAIKRIPPGLAEWLAFYKKIDTGFTLKNFKASGVSLHMGSLPEAISKGNEKTFTDLFVYSPDSTRYLDLVSYNYLRENKTLISGDPDQQVVLADLRNKSKKQLMYFGPSQLAEFADWTSNSSFMVGITSRTESGTGLTAEIMFFHLKDSLYTNFRFDHTISMDSILMSQHNFLDFYFINRQFNVQ